MTGREVRGADLYLINDDTLDLQLVSGLAEGRRLIDLLRDQRHTIADLIGMGLDQDISNELLALIGDRKQERDVVIAFLLVLSESYYGNNLSRHVKRLIRMAEKGTPLDSSIIKSVREVVEPS